MPQPQVKFGLVNGSWPWLVLGAVLGVAIVQYRVFDTEPDGEYPTVARPTFSAHPPAAYRLAEPGDTLDKVGLYLAAAGMVLSALAWASRRRGGRDAAFWPAALVVSIAAAWDCATPWPSFDAWYGLNWRAIGNPSSPLGVRLALITGALTLTAMGMRSLVSQRLSNGTSLGSARRARCGALLLAAAGFVLYRLVGWPDVEPVGYWPRWSLILGLLAFDLAVLRLWAFDRGVRSAESALKARPGVAPGVSQLVTIAASITIWVGLAAGGRWLIWFHRPLDRLHAVVPGRIYVSAMPSYRGLSIEQSRLHFRTIINVFNEHTPQRSSRLPEELRFIRERGLAYHGSPADPFEVDEFLDKTLELARDPSAWPILVHCHGCMDRSPAWMGIYRFLVQEQPLAEVLREIEAHRGMRPKASVTLLYNRVLADRAPERYANDPVARLLMRNAAGTLSPYDNRGRDAATLDSRPRLSRANPPTTLTPCPRPLE